MAITYVGKGAFVIDSGAPSPAWPSGHAADDIGLLVLQTANEDCATPSGWTFLGRVTNDGLENSPSACQVEVYYRIAVSASEANPTVSDSGNHTAAQIFAYRGVDTADPFAYSALGAAHADDREYTLTQASITTTDADAMVVHAIGVGRDQSLSGIITGAANAALTSIAVRDSNTGTNGYGGGVGLVDGFKASAGATGATDIYVDPDTRWAGLALALQPAGGTPGTATPAGVESESEIGAVTATGAATTSVAGVASVSSIGSVSAQGAALASPSGVASLAAIGQPIATGAATVALAGVGSASSIGAVTVTGAATVLPSGVESVSAVGPFVATGAANVLVEGVESESAIGIIMMSSARPDGAAGLAAAALSVPVLGWADWAWTPSGAATAYPEGVESVSAIGQVIATGEANALPLGAESASAIGQFVASGAATTAPAGVESAGSVGSVSAVGAASAEPGGVGSVSSIGEALASGAAQIVVSGVSSSGVVGVVVATGAATAYPDGVESVSAIGEFAAGRMPFFVDGAAIGRLAIDGARIRAIMQDGNRIWAG